MKRTATTIKIETELYDKFKILAVPNKVTLQDVVERSIYRYVNNKEFRISINTSPSSLSGEIPFPQSGENTINIVVNSQIKEWNKEQEISYEHLVKISNHKYTGKELYTVVYARGPQPNPQGCLLPGQKIPVQEKMIFNIADTSNA